ncbi:MAG: GNAT family N-acetyltransferase [Verrucomicrobia bacterium]|nr:GNAT family N-acetyltransferase [Verrucomicrobiota bacterium]
MSRLHVRAGRLADLGALEAIEVACFTPDQQSTRRALRLSLSSPCQSVLVAVYPDGEKNRVIGAAIVHKHLRRMRLYSIGVLPSFQGRNAGGLLMDRVMECASSSGPPEIILECDESNRNLVEWYERLGFRVFRLLPNYYGTDRHALRMSQKFSICPAKRLVTMPPENLLDRVIRGAPECR